MGIPNMSTVETEGPFAGWSTWKGDPYESHVGPMYYRSDENGVARCAFRAERKHVNGHSNLHGGMLMTFADYSLFAFAQGHMGEAGAVTISLSGDFTAAANEGDLIEAVGEVVHETPGMVFLRGRIVCGETTLLNYSGILKKLKARPASERRER